MKDRTKNTPQVLLRRALLVLMDAAIVAFSFYFALLLRADGAVDAVWWPHNRAQTNQKLRHKSSFQAAHFQRTQCPSSIAFYFMVLKAFQKFHPITPDIKPGCNTKSPGGRCGRRGFSEILGLSVHSLL